MVNCDPFSPEALADPYRIYAESPAHQPVSRSDRLRSWVVFRDWQYRRTAVLRGFDRPPVRVA